MDIEEELKITNRAAGNIWATGSRVYHIIEDSKKVPVVSH
jgi:hypothetical protein